MRHKLGIALVLLFAPAVALGANDAEKLKQLQQSVSASQAKSEQLAGTIDKTSKELDSLQTRAEDIARKVLDAERRLNARERELAKVSGELKTAEADYESRRAEYGRTVRSLLRMRELPASAYLAQPENMQHMLRTAAVMELTNKGLAEKAKELSSKIKALNASRQRVEAANRAVKNDQSQLKKEQTSLSGEVAKRQAAITSLEGNYAKEQARLRELSKQAKDVQELISKLDAQRRSAPPANLRKVSVGSGRAPAAGEVIHRFGEKKNANESWRGMVFKVRPHGTVVAPHDGEVVFTGPFRDYGPMVLLRHANGYISLLAGLGRLDVGLNQTVRGGEPLGAMPGTGSGELYVELREKSKPIDPTRWFAKLPSSLARD